MRSPQRSGGRRRLPASAAIAVLAVCGAVALTIGFVSQEVAPRPAVTASPPTATSEPSVPSRPPRSESVPATRALPASTPTSIGITSIGVRSPLITVGRNPDGSMQVPQPGPDYDKAAWYEHSPTPGEVGPSVIIGHIDSEKRGPSVFFRLGAMKPGDTVSVSRADGTTAVFAVDRVEKYPKAEFPTLEVYGNTDDPQLRLITCGGVFDEQAGNYLSNIVVYAHLTGSEPAA